VNDLDPVPHLPLQIQGYHHVPTEVWFDGKEYVNCDGSGRSILIFLLQLWGKILRRMRSLAPFTGKLYVITDFVGEDPNCSDSTIFAFSVHDHLSYMGVELEDGAAYHCAGKFDNGPLVKYLLNANANLQK
jgi:hypothetical protein